MLAQKIDLLDLLVFEEVSFFEQQLVPVVPPLPALLDNEATIGWVDQNLIYEMVTLVRSLSVEVKCLDFS